MDYEKCWLKLKDVLYTKYKDELKEQDGWTVVLTAKIMLELMTKIEREVQDNDQQRKG